MHAHSHIHTHTHTHTHTHIHTRLRSVLAEKESDHADSISSLQAKHATEIQTLKELLASSEANNTDLQKEVVHRVTSEQQYQ